MEEYLATPVEHSSDEIHKGWRSPPARRGGSATSPTQTERCAPTVGTRSVSGKRRKTMSIRTCVHASWGLSSETK